MPLLLGPTTPNWQRHQALPPARFRLFPFRSPLLRESLLLSFPVGTEMFQFPTFPLPVLCVQTGVTPHDGCWVSPFGHPPLALCSLEEQRCSCSLCNSQGGGADATNAGLDSRVKPSRVVSRRARQ